MVLKILTHPSPLPNNISHMFFSLRLFKQKNCLILKSNRNPNWAERAEHMCLLGTFLKQKCFEVSGPIITNFGTMVVVVDQEGYLVSDWRKVICYLWKWYFMKSAFLTHYVRAAGPIFSKLILIRVNSLPCFGCTRRLLHGNETHSLILTFAPQVKMVTEIYFKVGMVTDNNMYL